jgi:DNA-binding PadR family transcriptional regulator
VRRKTGELIPLEQSILMAGIDLRLRGLDSFHGFLMARELKERQDTRLLTAHGTLYKALDRLRRQGFLDSEWEDPLIAANAGRPRRRLYQVTAVGETALAQSQTETPRLATTRPGLASQ